MWLLVCISVKNMDLMILHTLMDLHVHVKESYKVHCDFLNLSICDFRPNVSDASFKKIHFYTCFCPVLNLHFTSFCSSICCSSAWYYW